MPTTNRARLSLWTVLGGLCLALTTSPAHAQSGATITVASFGGGLDVGYKKVFEKFEHDNNVTVRWVPGSASDNVAKAVASKSAPQYDVAMVEDVTYLVGVGKDVWAKVDPSIVTNYANLFPQAMQKNDSGVPIGGLSEGIFYRPAEFTQRNWPVPTTWTDLYRADYCGHIGLSHPNSSDGLRTLILMANGDPNGVPAVINKLAATKSCFPVLETTAPKLEEKIKSGEYWVGTANSIRAIPLIQAGVPITFFTPKSGTMASFSIAAPIKNGPGDAKMTQKFLNWFIDPAVQQQLMELLAYSPTNEKVKVPKNLADMGVLDEEGMKHIIKVDTAIIDKERINWARLVDRAWSN